MAQILKLNGVTFTDTSLPMIGDYGGLDGTDMTTLVKMASSALANTGTAGGAMAYVGNASSGYLPTFSDGILSVPDANAESKSNRYSLPSNITGLPFTWACLWKPATTARNSYILHSPSGGPAIMVNTTVSLVFYNGTTRTPNLGVALSAGVWHSLVVSVSGTDILASKNGAAPTTTTFASQGGAPGTPPSGRSLFVGSDSATQSAHGDFAAYGLWNRAMDADEMTSLHRAFRAFGATKDITV